MKKKIMIITGYYLPGIKGGGPIRSIKNLVDNLYDVYDFYIITSDRDLGDIEPYSDVKKDEWVDVGDISVFYTNKENFTWKKISKTINSIDYDVLYLNSFFSFRFSIIPVILKRARKITRRPIILAPRGEFSTGAINLKRTKKWLFIKMIKLLKLYNNVIWHATTKEEEELIKQTIGKNVKVRTANNLTTNYSNLEYNKELYKDEGKAKFVFLSRIHPKKNLIQAVKLLNNVKGEVEFNIYGPIEDNEYWRRCKKIIKVQPSNITVNYKGIAKHSELMTVFYNHHFLLFPTLGENFGHVISESLIGGCPVIISDKTPWKNLAELNIGWDISLYNNRELSETIQKCIDLNNEDYINLSYKAFLYAKAKSNTQPNIDDVHHLFS